MELKCANCDVVFDNNGTRRKFCCLRCHVVGRTDCTPGLGPKGDCWHWLDSAAFGGYGQIRVGKRMLRVHRVVYEEFIGPIPKHNSYHGMCVRHTCDNPICVRPDHLVYGTQTQNIMDAVVRKRFVTGVKNKQTKISDRDVKWILWLHSQGNVTQKRLSKVFGVSKQHMSRIIHRKRRIL